MAVITRDGFAFGFDPEACESCPGSCCIGTSGYIWVSRTEMQQVADFLGMDEKGLVQDYLRRIGNRFCLKELAIDGSFHCVFFDDAPKGCSIYPVRPQQCRTFPFWDYFKHRVKGAVSECPGVVLLPKAKAPSV